MRKLILILSICVWFISNSYPQEQIKPDLNFLRKVLEKENTSHEELLKAKAMVDAGFHDSRLNVKPEFWFYRGWVYEKIYKIPHEIAGVSKTDALRNMTYAYSYMEDESNSFTFKSHMNLETMWGHMLNNGVLSYQSGNLNEAIKYFQYSSLVKPTDTTGYLYAGRAAIESENYQVAASNYEQLIQILPESEKYLALASIYFYNLNDANAALKTLEQAKNRIGETPELLIIEIDIQTKSNNYNNGLSLLGKAISMQPNNSILYLKKALILEQMIDQNNLDKESYEYYQKEAEFAYEKTIEFDPNSLSAYFNLAVINSNRASEKFQEIENMSLQDFETHGKKLKEKALNDLNIAVGYMEKAYTLAPEDGDVLYALSSYYMYLGEKKKQEKINLKIKQLGF